MKTLLLKPKFLTLVFFIANLFFANVAFGQATVTTDKDDYAPGEVAIVTGTGWTQDQLVDLHFEEVPFVDHIHEYHDIVINSDGTFRVEFPIYDRHLGVTFTLTAEGKQSGVTAVWVFTDSHSVSSFTPTSGPTSGGTSIEISGSGFGPPSQVGTWMVKFGSLPEVPATRNSSNSLTVISPAHPAGSVSIVVFPSNNITVPVTASGSFTYTGSAATTLTVSSTTGVFGGTTNLSASLTTGSLATGVNGKTINFTLNGTSVGTAVTNASGVATLSNASLTGINAGTYPAGVSASFAADATYSASSGTNSLMVNKATPLVTWSNPADITYGTALSGTQLNATTTTAGSFVYTPVLGSILNAGNAQTLSVTFTPTDGANYNGATKMWLLMF